MPCSAVHARSHRFTTRNDTPYATALVWPKDGTLTVRLLAATSVALLSIFGAVHAADAEANRPNILFIVVDD
ncbi:MAG: hypothetical protein QGF59_28665, partial [Pirellulaceae bacterium]|nr:hypothetical protein [Pirellulaceae bacterium]